VIGADVIAWVKKHHFIIATLAPALILLSVFVYFPTAYSFYLSLFKTKLFQIESFVGLKNFTDIFADSVFWKGLQNTIIYTLGSVAGTLICGLLLALMLEARIRGKAFFRAVFFMPYIIPYAAYALIWYWLFDPRYGLLNYFLSFIGINPIPWLNSSSWVIPAFILMSVWKRMGFAMVLFLAGLLSIPDELYDAAIVDGVGWWSRLRYVTLPLLRPVTVFITIVSIVYSLQLFIEPFVMTKGGPANSSISVVYMLYTQGFRSLLIGKASAMGVILFLIIFVVSYVLIRRFNVEELY
jgi:ABC-type sugar transport system permease subunit